MIGPMLAALNLAAVLLGLGTGGLAASLSALVLGGALSLAGVPDGSGIGLVVGILGGLATGGWVSGRRAPHSSRFHGAVTGLLLAGLIIVVARLGGSQAPAPSVLLLAGLSAVVAGTAGWLAGRRPDQG